MSSNGTKDIMSFLRDEIWEQSQTIAVDANSYRFSENKSILDQPLKIIASQQPDILLIDFDAGEKATLSFIEIISTTWPTIMVVAVLTEQEEHLIQEVLLAGARIYLKYPFTGVELQNTLKRISKLHSQLAPLVTETDDLSGKHSSDKSCDILVVFSPRGGSGCTFLASNFALILQKSMSENVLLLKFDSISWTIFL